MKIFRIAAVLLALAIAAAGADFAALRPEGYVSDFARVIPSERRAELERYCKAVEAATGAQLALVTLPGLDGEPVEDVANLLYRKWGIGSKKTNEGALLLISIRDRRTRLEVGYGLEAIVPDGYAGSLLREMRPALRGGDIGGAMAAAAQTLGERIASSKGVRIGDNLNVPRPRQERVAWEGMVPLLVAGFVLFAILFMGGGGRRSGPRGGGGAGSFIFGLLAGMLTSSPRTHGGGGFGGYDSGDSFGGFGGGDSGGGGASSGW